jgi:hypothetical protein
LEARSPITPARTSGHHRRTRSTIADRTRPTRTAAAAAATARRTTTRSSRTDSSDGGSRSRATLDSEKSRRRASRTAWMTVLVNESIAPAVTACAGGTPCRWKKRMLTAMRARFEGSARFM